MIHGSHVVISSTDVVADRAFLTDVLALASLDAGGGWPNFDLSRAEATVHPSDASGTELLLMSDDLASEMSELAKRGARFTSVQEAGWGSVTKIILPGGGRIGPYHPRHPTFAQPGRATRHP